ncbi:MAG: phosphopyruvate hydratase [Lentisphaeria bacterium]|nr:phosphopyruvate hydratase [Lentisphaeria bacterium]
MCKITTINAREILDSRGNPTVEAEVFLSCGISGVASVPSGASVGTNEALELRDNDRERFRGRGVLQAVRNINLIISPLLTGINIDDQRLIDQMMIDEDDTLDKSHLGANAILAVSLAAARAAANYHGIELYRYLGGINACRLPLPMINIINGGRHAENGLVFQEFMIVPVGADSFSRAMQMGAEIFYSLKKVLHSYNLCIEVGDEGGFAPELFAAEDAFDCIIEAIDRAGYMIGGEVALALDCAASEFFDGKLYNCGLLRGKGNTAKFTSDEVIDYLANLCKNYPICAIEDPLNENDWLAWQKITEKIGDTVTIIGDDLFVTNKNYLRRGIQENSANGIIIKPNQIGTLTETLAVIENAQRAGFQTVISHRSGETADSFIADLSVAVNSPFVKCGSMCRGERIAKYNRFLQIERSLFENSIFNQEMF